MYRRFGKFKFRNYCFLCIHICTMLLLILSCVVFEFHLLWTIIPIGIIIYTLIKLYKRHSEYFDLKGNLLTIKKGRNVEKLQIPKDATVIFSKTTYRDVFTYQSAIIKNQYSISFVKNTSLENTVKTLHGNYTKLYTDRTIEENFGNDFIYNFVLEEENLKSILNLDYDSMIIPESLSNKTVFSAFVQKSYIDIGY